jgi:hypothetical protein
MLILIDPSHSPKQEALLIIGVEVIGAAGSPTIIAAPTFTHPFASVTVGVYDPAGMLLKTEPVPPLLQVTE